MHIDNIAKQKLAAGDLAIGVGLRQARTVDCAKIMKTAGFDWLFIDMEHNSMSIDTAVQISVAAQDAGITPLVRVPGFEHYHATRALDGGAQGIVVPHVDSALVAARLARNCRYPPAGRRSVTGALPQVDFQSLPLAEVTAAVNDSTLLVVMIETPAAVEEIEKIAAVKGIDSLLIGTSDLSMEMGIPGQVDNPRIVEVYQRVIDACRANNIYPGMGGVYDPPLMEKYVAMGMQLILAGSDLSFMAAAARQRAAAVRQMRR